MLAEDSLAASPANSPRDPSVELLGIVYLPVRTEAQPPPPTPKIAVFTACDDEGVVAGARQTTGSSRQDALVPTMHLTRPTDRMILAAAARPTAPSSYDPIFTQFRQKNYSMPGLSLSNRRALPVLMLCSVLLTWERIPLNAYQQPQSEDSASLPQDTVPDPGLATFDLGAGEQDRDRLFQLLEGARILADRGAGYEAARVIAGLALQASDQDPGREALQLLESWGLSVDAVRRGQPAALNARISQSIKQTQRNDTLPAHAHNLITLQRFDQAARVVRSSLQGGETDRAAARWGALLKRYRVPLELLRADSRVSQLSRALQRGQARLRLLQQARVLQVFDQRAGELARQLVRRMEPRQPEEDWRERNPFARLVDRERGNRDRPGEGPPLEDLAEHVLRYAEELSQRSPEAAQILTRLVALAAPRVETRPQRRNGASKKPQLGRPAVRRRPRNARDTGVSLFPESGKQVHAYQLQLSDESLALLRDEPKEYVQATFRFEDEVYRNVGVRLKGSWGSFRMLDGQSKAAFTIKFNAFQKKQRFHGMRRIILNNGVQDPSYLDEHICYSLFRDAGIPAPRTAYAELTVNGDPYGLYIQVEAATRDFLGRWFSDPRGNLYEGPGDVVEWRELDRDTNQDDVNRDDLRRLAEAIEEADDRVPWTALAEYVSVDDFALFLALEQFVGHFDGYTQTNNYRIYNDPTEQKFHFVPHGADQVFEDLTASIFGEQRGILGRALLQTEQGKQHYLRALQRIANEIWDEDVLRDRVAVAYQLIRPHVVARQGKELRDSRQFEEAVRHKLRFLSFRRYAVLGQLNSTRSAGSWRVRVDHQHLPSFLYRSHGDW